MAWDYLCLVPGRVRKAFAHLVKYGSLVPKNFAETTNILPGKARVHFTIFPKLAAHEIVWRFDADNLEAVGKELHKYIT